MNQILSVEMPNRKNKKTTKKANIKSVIIFFCIVLVLFGCTIIGLGLYSQMNEKENLSSNNNNIGTVGGTVTGAKPRIDISQNSSELMISIVHDNAISKIIYNWNNGQDVEVNGDGQSSIDLEINIPEGTNELNIRAIDVNGVEESYTKKYVGAKEPVLQQINNKLKVSYESETTIDYVAYCYDDQEEKIEKINATTAEVLIDLLEGEHELTIRVVDINGIENKSSKKIYIPTVKVITDTKDFFITATDIRGITRVDITINDNETQQITLNEENEYTNTIPLEMDLKENRITVVVYNKDGLSFARRVRFEKQS